MARLDTSDTSHKVPETYGDGEVGSTNEQETPNNNVLFSTINSLKKRILEKEEAYQTHHYPVT